MSQSSRIEWTDATWNPIRGTKGRWHCTHVSEGCRNCYAERLNVRWGGPAYRPGADIFRLDEKVLQQPRHWKRPRKIFAMDMSDLFHEDIPSHYIYEVFVTMARCPQHTFQVLTKRPRRMLEVLNEPELGTGRKRYPPLPANVWLGVSVEDQQTADERIPLLLQTPAAVRFVSYEPALGPVDFKAIPGFDWLIVGGESGPTARPFALDWARSAISQCKAASVACFVKQVGSKPVANQKVEPVFLPLHHPKGGDPQEWPEDLRVREWPK